MIHLNQAQQILQKYFSYSDFRPNQKPIIQAILEQQNVLAILPTGGGKSICFQIPGLVLAGTTIVISPLISLMQDQVTHLEEKNIAATFINSSLTTTEQQLRLEKLTKGKYKFFYLAPERLTQQTFIKACKKITVPLVVIDEAHCISLWGYDFRPSYQNIAGFVKQLPVKPIIAAFTATATTTVIKDIGNFLELKNLQIISQPAVRENLAIHIYPCPIGFIKEFLLFVLLKKHLNQSGIIYTATRKAAEEVTGLVKHYDFYQQYQIAYYHGGMTAEKRQQVQDDFLQNKLKIIVATNAFGMGVDKSNIRFVIHFQIPGNLENYSQEIGRAGRDQQSSDCYLFYYQPDLLIQQQFIEQKTNLQRKKIEKKKLKTMIRFIETFGCYQQKIAQYFGQKKAIVCHQCSDCLREKLPQMQQLKQRFEQLQQFFNQQINNKEDLYDFPEKILLNLALHQPQTVDQCLKIAGIGQGWIAKWYKLFTQFHN